jgi:ABC-type phosphate transport system permease subunit
VNNRGAVSPAMRATASSTPVTTPAFTARRRTIIDTFQRGAPSANAASSRLFGTRCSMLSVVRTTDNMLHLVPNSLLEAAFALGAPRWKVSMMVRLRAVKAGVVTGVLLAVARIAGETAPLLFTALNNQFFSLDMKQPMANLPVAIYLFAMSSYEDWRSLAWGAALLVTFSVLLLNILSRTAFRQKNPQ